MNVLLITAGFFHPPRRGRQALHQALAQADGFSFQHVRSLEQLPDDLGSFAALVLYFHHKAISVEALTRLDAFVRNGGGLLAVHSATASFKDQPHYFDIIGGQFTGHGAVANIEVKQVKDDIFGGIGDFFVKDELYWHSLQPGIDVHFSAQHDGQSTPIVWTYRYGTGRVCYAMPGHTVESMRHPAMQEILRRGLMWVSQSGAA
jgi:type 1 glutamine amidotransferase